MASTQNPNNIAGQQLNTQILSNLNKTNKQAGVHQNKLATGKKINSAEDDPAILPDPRAGARPPGGRADQRRRPASDFAAEERGDE